MNTSPAEPATDEMVARAEKGLADRDNETVLQPEVARAILARLRKAEAERDEALMVFANGAYDDACKREVDIYQHGLALAVHHFRAAEAREADLRVQLEQLGKRYSGLVAALDKQHGTPCEQIRHQQEVDDLRAKLKTAREDEREQCVRIADDLYGEGPSGSFDNGGTADGWNLATQAIATAIRARTAYDATEGEARSLPSPAETGVGL